MDKRTLTYALQVLDKQREHIETKSSEQNAYYDGMQRMLEIIISEAYTEPATVIYRNGKHSILA